MSSRSGFLRRAIPLVAVAALGLGLAPAASAQLQVPDPATASAEMNLPSVETAPVPGAGNLPFVPTFPVLGPTRPVPNYGNVGVFPSENEVVGVASPIHFFFDRPITDRRLAEQTIGIRTEPNVAGKFYWINDRELRWRPLNFWPERSAVTVWAAGRQHTFRTGDALIATYDDHTKKVTVTRSGQVVREMRASSGEAPRWSTYNGIYYTGQRGREVRMNSALFGLRVEDGGYDSIVNDAVRLSYDGIYIHSAPWSIADQGVRNATHGCINVSPEDAAWYYNNSKNGDPFIVKNSVGRQFGAFDGQGDWNY